MDTKRFNPDCTTFDAIVDYYKKRARQLLKFSAKLEEIQEIKEGAIAIFSDEGNSKYYSLYLYPEYRGLGLYEKLMSKDKHIVTSDNCGLVDFLIKKKYKYLDCYIYDEYYKYISDYYGNKTAKRSGVELMNHIDEGLAILNFLNLSEDNFAIAPAYCLHPILQSDKDLLDNCSSILNSDIYLDSLVLMYVMEYRSVANEYLSGRKINSIDEIRLSPLKGVNNMLIADKIQNFKDFQLYHQNTHPRSKELTEYFNNWLKKLGISEEKYNEIINKLIINPIIKRI